METAHGRKAKSIDEAQAFILAFMHETLNKPSEAGYGKSYDFDLFLPWMMSWILNVPQKEEQGFTATDDLEVIYMEAAWDLVMKGILRPGTRGTGGEGTGGEYGKGYSMTTKGKEWLAEFARSQPPEEENGSEVS